MDGTIASYNSNEQKMPRKLLGVLEANGDILM